MRLLHLSDLHANANIDKYLKSLNQVKDFVVTEKNKIDCILFGGDLTDSRIPLAEESNFILRSFAELANLAPIFMVYGTPSHDIRGSLDNLPHLKTKYPIQLIDKIDTKSYHLSYITRDLIETKFDAYFFENGCYIFGVPWLMRSRILNNEELKLLPAEQEKIFKQKFDQWLQFRREFKKSSKIPVIMVAHLQLLGSVFSKGQDVSSEYHDPEWFFDICDYGALGHIHNAHHVKNLYYSGSCFNKTCGEMEEKFFNVITIEDNKIVDIEQVKFDTPLLMKADLGSVEEYEDFVRDWKRNEFDTDNKKVELWINLIVKSKEAFGYEKELTFWKSFSNLENVRFDVSEMKIESQHRVEEIKTDATLVEKAVIWAESKGKKLTEFQKNRIKKLETD